MILRHIRPEIKTFFKLKCSFAQTPKKRTQAPKYGRSKQEDRIDPKKIDYSVVPEQLRKGVKAYVQASNMLVTSQAELQSVALKEVILQERQKFKETLDQLGETPQAKAEGKEKKDDELEQQKNYDLMSATKFLSNVSNGMMVMNIAGYMLFHTAKKFEMLGFFLGASINPSIIALTGLSIGFNAAAWVIIQSLHLSQRDPQQLTLDKISLTGCNTQMYLQALSIAIQTAGLSYYLMQPRPFDNIGYLIGSFILSQTQMSYNIIRATGGYKFQYFSKILITQIMSSLLVGYLAYSLFSKINETKTNDESGQILNVQDPISFDENLKLKEGYEKFLSQFKAKDISIVKGQAINKLILDETK